jgi:uncharacterized protein
MAQNNDDVDLIATKYLNNNVINEDALQGARDIIAEWINENIYVQTVAIYQRTATVSTKVKKQKKKKSTKVSSIFRLVRTIK